MLYPWYSPLSSRQMQSQIYTGNNNMKQMKFKMISMSLRSQIFCHRTRILKN